MKILFLQESNLEESLGVANLSAVLKANGHICDVLVQSAEGKDFFNKIKAINPQIAAFSCATGAHVWANKVAGEVKKINNAVTIMGGMHPTIYSEESIKEENIDIICIGEGEYPLLDLANNLEKGSAITGIQNLWVKKENRVYKNDLRNLNDVNSLPFPDRGLYYKYDYNCLMTAKRFISSLGCPFHCSFCQNTVLIKKFKGKGVFIRKKNVDRVIKEVLLIKEKYPLDLVHFSDDIFALDKSWLREFSQKFKKQVNLPFNCNIRISCADKETIELLSQAGCHAVTFGLESGNEFLRNEIISKNIVNEEIIEKSSILKDSGIKILTSNMIVLPNETIDNAYETIHLNRKIRVDYTRIFIAKPFKGTKLFEYGEENGLLEPHVYSTESFENLDNTFFKNEHKKELLNLRYLFREIIRHPALEPLSRFLIKLPLSGLYKIIFFYNRVIQEQRFFKVNFFRGIRIAFKLRGGFGKKF